MAHIARAIQPAAARALVGLTAALLLSACSQTMDLLPKSDIALANEVDESDKNAVPQNELQKATTYWGQEYAKRPAELKPAMNYARNLKALGEKSKAMAVLQHAASFHDGDKELAGEYGRLALDLGQVGAAGEMLRIADDPAKPDWKIISARGTVLAKQGNYKEAITFYDRALALQPNQSSVLNNMAMAYAMSGEAKRAEEILRQAQTQPGGDTAKVKQNLALVLGVQGRYDEAKLATLGASPGSSADSTDNVDMLRKIVKLDPKAAPKPTTALADAAVPDFKTKVNRAIVAAPFANAPLAATLPAQPAATAAPAEASAQPLKAAVNETLVAPAAVWETNVAANESTSGLRGSSK